MAEDGLALMVRVFLRKISQRSFDRLSLLHITHCSGRQLYSWFHLMRMQFLLHVFGIYCSGDR